MKAIGCESGAQKASGGETESEQAAEEQVLQADEHSQPIQHR